MYENAYDIVAMGMRYFFLLLILYILIRLVQHSVSEFRAVQQIKQQVRSVSPGYLEVKEPESLRGEKYALRREDSLGRAKRCTIPIQLGSLAPVHAFFYEKKDGLYVMDYGSSAGVLLNGERIRKREELLYTSDILQMGELVMKLHLAGEEEDDA